MRDQLSLKHNTFVLLWILANSFPFEDRLFLRYKKKKKKITQLTGNSLWSHLNCVWNKEALLIIMKITIIIELLHKLLYCCLSYSKCYERKNDKHPWYYYAKVFFHELTHRRIFTQHFFVNMLLFLRSSIYTVGNSYHIKKKKKKKKRYTPAKYSRFSIN